MQYEVTDAIVYPAGQLDVLSKIEVSRLLDTSQGGLYELFRIVHSLFLTVATNLMMAENC